VRDEIDPETGLPMVYEPASYEVWERPIVSPRTENLPAEPTADRVEELRAMPYSEYLETPEWRVTRRHATKAAEDKCQRCGRLSRRLDVHHRTYERLGREDSMSDLEVLCRQCHQKEHGFE
jgi:5-methylcytosine-specific restriction endonuclease McrA